MVVGVGVGVCVVVVVVVVVVAVAVVVAVVVVVGGLFFQDVFQPSMICSRTYRVGQQKCLSVPY